VNHLKQERDLVLVHLALAALVAAALMMQPTVPLGLGLLVAVVGYNILLPMTAIWSQHHTWLRLWLFLAPLSAMMLLPDWFLAKQLGVLVFPDTGAPRIGEVPIFMMGMWTIPLFLIVHFAQRYKPPMDHAVVLTLSAALFLGSEAVLWRLPVWHAQNVWQVANVAIYLIVPELILGLTAYWGYLLSERRSLLVRLGTSYLVMVIYLGNLALFYFLVERIWAK
jgi:hypothetical protein